jgi:hypothetical protein
MHYKATRGVVTSSEWKFRSRNKWLWARHQKWAGTPCKQHFTFPETKACFKKTLKKLTCFQPKFRHRLNHKFSSFQVSFLKKPKNASICQVSRSTEPGLPDVYFSDPIWVYFGGPWNGKCFWSFGIFYDNWVYYVWAFGNLVVIWYIFYRFGTLYQVKSGNPGQNCVLPEPRWWIQFSTFLERSNSDAKPLEYLVRTWLTFRNCDWNSWDGFLAPLVFCIALNHFNLQG